MAIEQVQALELAAMEYSYADRPGWQLQVAVQILQLSLTLGVRIA